MSSEKKMFELATCPHCGSETRKAKFCGNCAKPLRSTRKIQEKRPLWKAALIGIADYLAACGRDRKKLYNLLLAIVLTPIMIYVVIIILQALLMMSWGAPQAINVLRRTLMCSIGHR